MCLGSHCIRHLWVLIFEITLRSVALQQPRLLSECVTPSDYNTEKSIFCRTGEIIQIEDVGLYRSNSQTHCEALTPSNVSPYPCETMSTEVIDTIWRECDGQHNCRYELEYPDEDDCPVDHQPYRNILLVISLECVLRPQPFPTAPTSGETDHDKTGTVIGAAVGGAAAGILVTIIVVMVIVFLLRKRSRAKSPQESIGMETNTNAIRMQPNVYAESKGFEEGNTNSGYYAEIPDLAADDQGNSKPGKVLETNSVRGTRYTGNYEEIVDIHRNSLKVDNYEEIPDIVTNLPGGKDDVTGESHSEGNHGTTKPGDIAHTLYDNNTGEEPQNRDSLFDQTRSKPISIVKSDDEIVVMENEIYMGGAVENDDVDKET